MVDLGSLSIPLQTFVDRVTVELTAAGVPPSSSTPLAERVFTAVLEELHGAYIPPITTYRRILRDEKIRALFTGGNVSELAERFDLTPQTIRNLIRK